MIVILFAKKYSQEDITMKTGNKTIGIVSIVLGAIAICTFWIPVFNIVSLIAAIVGLVLAINSKKSFREADVPSPVPKVGLILSIIGLSFSVIGFLTCTVCSVCVLNEAANNPSLASELSSALNSALSSTVQ